MEQLLNDVETFIMNLYRAMDREKVQFDFLYHYDMPCFYDEEILRLGGRITKLTVRQDNNLPRYLHQLNEFFARHTEYRVIHGHYSGFGMFYNAAARKNGITVRAGHSHNTNYEHNLVGWLDRAMSFFFTYGLTDRFACGQEAGKALFRGKPFRFLPNGVDAAAFGPDEAQRAALRRQLGVPEGAPLYGHINPCRNRKPRKYGNKPQKRHQKACLSDILDTKSGQCFPDRISRGDGVYFERGGTWRGQLWAQAGVIYSAYGEGEKPKIFASPENGAAPEKWTLLEGTNNIWIYHIDMMDCGIIVFNDGESWGTKVAPYYMDGYRIV